VLVDNDCPGVPLLGVLRRRRRLLPLLVSSSGARHHSFVAVSRSLECRKGNPPTATSAQVPVSGCLAVRFDEEAGVASAMIGLQPRRRDLRRAKLLSRASRAPSRHRHARLVRHGMGGRLDSGWQRARPARWNASDGSMNGVAARRPDVHTIQTQGRREGRTTPIGCNSVRN
jgi:hypothetical protein